jgi:hypothetical protein
MAIDYFFKTEGNLLEVTASGFDGSLDEVQEYGMAIIQEALRGNHTLVLCDETRLEYRLGTLDTFKSAEFISEQAPKLARVAIVCNNQSFQDARFWETVVVNRGLSARFFKDISAARNWLGEYKTNQGGL